MKVAVLTFPLLFGWIVFAIAQESLPSEVEELSAKYEAAMADADGGISQLKQSYAKRLETLARDAQAKGELENVMVIKTELEKLATEAPGKKSGYSPLAQAQEVYHEHANIAKGRSYPDQVRIEKAYVEALETFVADFTKNGKIDDALATKSVLEKAEKRLSEWSRLADVDSNSGTGFGPEDWSRLRKIVSAGQLFKTETVGGNPQLNDTTKDLPENGAILVGFDLYMAEFGGSRRDTVRKMVPLWKTEREEFVEGIPRANSKGQRRRILAKDGFAIGGITTVSEAGVRKVKFKFQPINGIGLSNSDAYETGWYGDWDGGREAELTTGGKLAVGLDGWVGLGTGEFWLLCAEPK